MMKDSEEHLELIKSLFLNMGASEKQAQTMASQLLKRARQISNEGGITLTESVEKLLKQVVEARKS
ncbi:MAG: LDH2 family malate/lactate/ureidoglycolate dehydrogenase [Lentimonas sp.]|jgi:LDH2 family malate/lactate/ureidoglycolate dehydrogenase